MKVTYIYPPLFQSFYPMSTRMITENLLRNNNLDVSFSDIPVTTYSSNIQNEVYDTILPKAINKFSSNITLFLKQKYIVNNIFYVFMTHGYFNKYILQGFDDKYIIVTCLNFCDLIIVKHLLESDKKVVMGGPLINIGLSPAFIREFLSEMGVVASKLNNDLIVVAGNIDLTTDLYEIIKGWKDTVITHNDYSTMYECERDYLQQYYDGSSLIPVHFGFTNWCWYGKCKFCTYKELPRIDFLGNTEEAKVVKYVNNIMSKFGSTHIRFIDSYYRLSSPSAQNILGQIKEYDISIYTGIMLLKNNDYIALLNKYVNRLLIGLESTSDFSLRYVNKGYTYKDIEIALDNIIRHLDRKIFLEISLILDLPSRDVADVEDNYKRIAAIKQKLIEAGFKVGIHLNILSVFPNMELLYGKNSLLKRSDDASDIHLSSGKNYLIHLLRECGMDNPLLLPSESVIRDKYHSQDLCYGYISSDVPVVRYDINGNVLPSDLHLIDDGSMMDILARTKRQ